MGKHKNKRADSPAKKCALCLYRVGLGCVRIGRIVRRDKVIVARWVKASGLTDPERQIKSWSLGGLAKARNMRRDQLHRERFNGISPMHRSKSKSGRKGVAGLPLFTFSDADRFRFDYKTKPLFRIKHVLRGRIRKLLKKGWKSCRTLELIGCSMEDAKRHIESTWQPGMTWETHGQHGWHIDHIVPCASFNLMDQEEQKRCFHYTNLQALWAKDNLSKSSKVQGTVSPTPECG